MAEDDTEVNPTSWDTSLLEERVNSRLQSAFEHLAHAAVWAHLIGRPLESVGDAEIIANITRILGLPPVEIVEEPAIQTKIDTIPLFADNFHRRTNSGLIGLLNTDNEHEVQLSDKTEAVDDSRLDFVVDQDKLNEFAQVYGLRPRHTQILKDILIHYGGGELFSSTEAFNRLQSGQARGTFNQKYSPLARICIDRGVFQHNGKSHTAARYRVVTEVAREFGLIIQQNGTDADTVYSGT